MDMAGSTPGGGDEQGGFRQVALNWGPTLVFNVAAPILTYKLMTDHGASSVNALLVSSLWPFAEVAFVFVRRRRLDDFGMLTLLFMGLSLISAAFFHSERMLLIKESVVTGVFGLICLGSLAAPRPLMFYFGRKFGTDGTEQGIAFWNSLWQYEGFRKTQRLMTTVWGVAYLVEAGVRIALTYVLSRSAAVTMNNTVPYAVLGLLLFWTIRLGKKRRAAAEAAGMFPDEATSPQAAAGSPVAVEGASPVAG
jgi:hypothetical protein